MLLFVDLPPGPGSECELSARLAFASLVHVTLFVSTSVDDRWSHVGC